MEKEENNCCSLVRSCPFAMTIGEIRGELRIIKWILATSGLGLISIMIKLFFLM